MDLGSVGRLSFRESRKLGLPRAVVGARSEEPSRQRRLFGILTPLVE